MAAAKSSDFQKLNEAVDEIVDGLICKICKGFPKPGQPRWYKCSDLHYICQLCVESKKVDKCSCKKKISKKVDKVTETLLKLETLKFKCQFCMEGFTSGAITCHEIECTKRLVMCPHKKCGKMVKFQDVLSHYDSRHYKIYEVKSGSNQVASYDGDIEWYRINFRFARKIEAFGKVFLCMSTIKDGIMYDWVQLLGLPSEAEDFVFSLEYKGPKTTLAFFGQVASIDETFNTVISRGKCSTNGSEVFNAQFMVDKKKSCEYSYVITIKKLDEETNQ